MGSKMQSLLLTLLVAINGIVLTEANYYCYSFDKSSEWTNTGSRDWIWSLNSDGTEPDYTNIPAITGHSGYMWLQDQETPPNTGTIVSTPATGVTIYPNDVVSIDIWRHIVYNDGAYRPVLNFVSNGGVHKQNILWSYNVDGWDHVALICGPMAEPCCLTYPCTGYFSVDGSILGRDELLAIDNVEINSGCAMTTPEPPTTTTTTPTTTTTTPTTTTTTPTTTTTTPTTTLPPPPPNWCCNFESISVCDWSLAFSSNGWHWTGRIVPTHSVPDHTYYIWEEDESAEVFSTELEEVPNDSYITIDYYFSSDVTTEPAYNNLQFYFASNVGPEILLQTVSDNTADWQTLTLTYPDGFCNNNEFCAGTFTVHSNNRPGNKQVSAVDNFDVNSACEYPYSRK